MHRPTLPRPRAALLVTLLAAAACRDDGEIEPPDAGPGDGGAECARGARECPRNVFRVCGDDGTWQDAQDCRVTAQLCDVRIGCVDCSPADEGAPKSRLCGDDGLSIHVCEENGTIGARVDSCDPEAGEVCRDAKGQTECVNACEVAKEQRSYVGCEYYAVDLDNANVSSGNAAAQQFAVVVSNPSRLVANVTVEQNDAQPGEEPALSPAPATDPDGKPLPSPFRVEPEELRVVLLPPREVDGSPPGERPGDWRYDQGTHSALTSNAWRITSTAPLIAYQFNPLENVGVFSNDASLLVPVTALGDSADVPGPAYHVMGWPQTIAVGTPNALWEQDLRATLTIVGTQADTQVEVHLGGGIAGQSGDGEIVPVPGIAGSAPGDILRVTLQPFDVLNLESESFLADFTGTDVWADEPIVVFSGSEASDVPDFKGIERRRCCADHLEEQLFPIGTLGRTFVAVHSPSRTCALEQAGADLTCLPRENECFRLLAPGGEFETTVRTSLPAPADAPRLAPGLPFTLCDVREHFVIEADSPIVVGQFIVSQQEVVGANNNEMPAGDPAFILLPPVEQYRDDYLFLLPDKYAFDYLMIAAPANADVELDGTDLAEFESCERENIAPLTVMNEEVDFVAIVCAMSDPVVARVENRLLVDHNLQNDGVHRLTSTLPVGLVAYGFDAFVSYGYPAGTDLAPINVR